MPYTYNQTETRMNGGTTVTIATTGDKATWCPGKFPHYIRGVMLVAKTAGAEVGVVKFDKRITAGSDTGRGDGDVAILNVPNPFAQGRVLVKENIRVKINPGEEVVAEVTDAVAGITSCDLILITEVCPEIADNITAITETA